MIWTLVCALGNSIRKQSFKEHIDQFEKRTTWTCQKFRRNVHDYSFRSKIGPQPRLHHVIQTLQVSLDIMDTQVSFTYT